MADREQEWEPPKGDGTCNLWEEDWPTPDEWKDWLNRTMEEDRLKPAKAWSKYSFVLVFRKKEWEPPKGDANWWEENWPTPDEWKDWLNRNTEQDWPNL